MSYENLAQHRPQYTIETLLRRFKPPFDVLTTAEGDFVVDQCNDKVTTKLDIEVARSICGILNAAYKKYVGRK
jgi:hypothetical protein